jgi:hypothetical protein
MRCAASEADDSFDPKYIFKVRGNFGCKTLIYCSVVTSETLNRIEISPVAFKNTLNFVAQVNRIKAKKPRYLIGILIN